MPRLVDGDRMALFGQQCVGRLATPEQNAVAMARPMNWLSVITAPFVWILERSSALIFKLLGFDKESKNHVTAEELHLVVAEAQTAGVLEEDERNRGRDT